MASQTLAEAAKLINDEIVRGVAEDIIDIDPMMSLIPFDDFTGQSITVNRENALGDAQKLAVGGTITAKAAATFTEQVFLPTTVIGDAEMNGLVQACSLGDGVDQQAIEISSKAKSVGRIASAGLATDDGSAPNLNSLHSMVDSGQYTPASAGQALSFALLDALLNLVKAKDGIVDYILMPERTMISYKILLRALGGSPAEWVVTLPDGRTTIGYESIPIFKNTYLSIVETANGAALTGGALTSVWAGCFDDGSRKIGLSGIHPTATPAGIVVQNVGVAETKDEEINRVKWYMNWANFNRKGLARLPSINN